MTAFLAWILRKLRTFVVFSLHFIPLSFSVFVSCRHLGSNSFIFHPEFLWTWCMSYTLFFTSYRCMNIHFKNIKCIKKNKCLKKCEKTFIFLRSKTPLNIHYIYTFAVFVLSGKAIFLLHLLPFMSSKLFRFLLSRSFFKSFDDFHIWWKTTFFRCIQCNPI